jgi:hypothetical protein
MATIPSSAPTPAPDAQVSANPIGRMFGALFSPRATFEDIARRPSWIAPIVFLTVISLGVSLQLAQKVNWERVVTQRIEKDPRAAQLTPEQRERSVSLGAKIARVSVYVFGVLSNLLMALILATVFLGAFNLMAGMGVRFGTAMAITSHSLLPTAISGVLAIAVLAIKDPETVDPEHLLASNLGGLVPSDAPKWLDKLASSFDLFVFWILFLLATGFAAASPKKVSMGKAVGIVFGFWAAFVLVKVGLAAVL